MADKRSRSPGHGDRPARRETLSSPKGPFTTRRSAGPSPLLVAADPAAVAPPLPATEAPEAAPEFVHDDAATLSFTLTAARRSNVTPRDVTDAALWAVLPLDHPRQTPCMRWLLLTAQHTVRHCVVVYVEGLSYDRIMCGAHRSVAPLPPASGEPEEGEEELSPEERRARHLDATEPAPGTDFTAEAAAAPNRWLHRVRRVAGAQVAPLWVPNTTGRVDQDFFFRGADKASKPKPATSGMGAVMAQLRTEASTGTSPTPAPEPGQPAQPEEPKAAAAKEDAPPPTEEEKAAADEAALRAEWATPGLAPLALSREQLMEHGFTMEHEAYLPLPAPDAAPEAEHCVAIDCEMVLCETGSVLARVSVVRCPTGEVLYDSCVKPALPVLDYVTRYSGITEEMLRDEPTTLAMAQAEVARLVSSETFVVGHSLENDFKALQLLPGRVVDTACHYPHPNGLPNKNSLKYLAVGFLGRRIQQAASGHDSVEDATACIELITLKLRHGPEFGAPRKVNVLRSFAAAEECRPPFAAPRVGVVARPDVARRIGHSTAEVAMAASDTEAVRKACGQLRRFRDADAEAAAGTFQWVQLADIADEPEAEAEAANGEAAHDDGAESGAESETAPVSTEGKEGKDKKKKRRERHRVALSRDGATRLDQHLAMLHNAAPPDTVFLVAAARPAVKPPGQRGGGTGRHVTAHGMLLGLVKSRHTAPLCEEATEAGITKVGDTECKQQ